MTTPINLAEKERFVSFEKKIQRQLDVFYEQMGWQIIRDSQRTHDLKNNGARVEEKIRSEKRKDFAIEVCQDIVSGNKGWFSTVKASYIYYVMCENNLAVKLYAIDWPAFKEWFVNNYLNCQKQGTYIASTRGYGATINLKVLIDLIPLDLYKEYDVIGQRELL